MMLKPVLGIDLPIAPLRAQAELAGSGDFSPLWCGQNATGCREIGAAQLTRKLAAGALRAGAHRAARMQQGRRHR